FQLGYGKSGRCLGPFVALGGEIIAEVEQLLHIRALEWLLECPGEGSGDVCEVEIHAVAPCGEIDPIEVADALRLNQRGNGPPGNAQCPPLDLRPIRVKARVADDVEVPIAFDSR